MWRTGCCLLLTTLSLAADELAWSKWKKVVETSFQAPVMDAAAVERAGEELREFLQKGEHVPQRATEEKIGLTVAQAWAKAGDYQKALQHFLTELRLQRSLDRSIFAYSRAPELRMLDVMGMHALLHAFIDDISPEWDSGYRSWPLTFPNGNHGTVFLFATDEEEEGQFLIKGIMPEEQRKMLFLFVVDQKGGVRCVDQKHFTALREGFNASLGRDEAKPSLELEGVKKVIGYRGLANAPALCAALQSKFAIGVTEQGFTNFPEAKADQGKPVATTPLLEWSRWSFQAGVPKQTKR